MNNSMSDHGVTIENLPKLFPLPALAEGVRYVDSIELENFASMMESAEVAGHHAVADVAIYPGASSCDCEDFSRRRACAHLAAVVVKYLCGDKVTPWLRELGASPDPVGADVLKESAEDSLYVASVFRAGHQDDLDECMMGCTCGSVDKENPESSRVEFDSPRDRDELIREWEALSAEDLREMLTVQMQDREGVKMLIDSLMYTRLKHPNLVEQLREHLDAMRDLVVRTEAESGTSFRSEIFENLQQTRETISLGFRAGYGSSMREILKELAVQAAILTSRAIDNVRSREESALQSEFFDLLADVSLTLPYGRYLPLEWMERILEQEHGTLELFEEQNFKNLISDEDYLKLAKRWAAEPSWSILTYGRLMWARKYFGAQQVRNEELPRVPEGLMYAVFNEISRLEATPESLDFVRRMWAANHVVAGRYSETGVAVDDITDWLEGQDGRDAVMLCKQLKAAFRSPGSGIEEDTQDLLKPFDAIEILHREGMEEYRVICGEAPNGGKWQFEVILGHWLDREDPRRLRILEEFRELTLKFTGGGHAAFLGLDLADATPEAIARSIDHQLRRHVHGDSDPEYAEWFSELLEICHEENQLAVAYYESQPDEFWKIGRDFKFPVPPAYPR